jgi:hypothetical protein
LPLPLAVKGTYAASGAVKGPFTAIDLARVAVKGTFAVGTVMGISGVCVTVRVWRIIG